MNGRRKVGIMGGTFNPIHIGHLIMAECAYDQFALDKVLFIPSKNPPHKTHIEIATTEDRVNMVELAIKDNPHFELSLIEVEREGKTYSVDTLSQLVKQNLDIDYYFIIGADSLYNLDKWKSPKELLSLTNVIVASRYGIGDEKLLEQIEKTKDTLGGNFYLADVPTIEVSSSEIRLGISERKSVRYQLPEAVYNYIQQNELYRKR